MVRECLSQYAASSKARALRTSLICANRGAECFPCIRILVDRFPGAINYAQPGGCRCSKEPYPHISKRWRGFAATRRSAHSSLLRDCLTPDGKASGSQAREQEGIAIDTAPPAVKPSWQVTAVCPPNRATYSRSVSTATVRQVAPPFGAADGSTARQITQLITRAQTWADLATITYQCGGASALNEIHLSAALNRLAKMNLAVATGLTRQHQHQARQRLPEVLQGPSIPIGSPPATSSLVPSRGDVYAFPPPASAPAPGHPSVSRIGPPQPLITTPLRSQSRTLFAPQAPFAAPWISIGPPPPDSPLADVGQPVSLSAPRPLLSPDAEPAGNRRVSELLHQHVAVGSGILDTGPIAASAHDTRGPVQARPAASPEELCVELLEALACRGGGAPIGHASSALAKDTLAENHTADSNGHRGLGPGTSRRKLVSPDRVAISGGQTRVADLAAVATAPSPSPPPLPARVVANAAWSAARLVMQLWPRRQSCATEEAASPLPGRALSDISGNRLPIAGFGSQGLPQDGATRPDWVVGSNASPTLQHRSWAALRALLALVVDAAPFMEPQHLSNMLYTVARLATSLPEVLEAPCGGNSDRESSSHSDGTCAVETAETTAAEAVSATTGDAEVVLRGRALAQRLMEVLLDASLPKLSSFGPQALSNSLYAVAFLGISPPQRWLRAWLDVSARQLLRADPQHIANMLWALARLGCDPGDRWVMTALQAAALKVSAFTTQGLCNTLWALAKIGFTADSVSKAHALLPLASALGSAARECDGQDVANGMWALARLHMRLQPLQPLAPGTGGSKSPGAAALFQPFSGSPDANQEGVLAEARNALQATGRKLLQASSRHLSTYNAQQLANTCWATAALGLQPPPDWEPQFWPAALVALPAMRTEELVAIAMASARIQLQPLDQWLEAVLKFTTQAMLPGSSSPQQRSSAAMEAVASGGAESLSPRSQTRIQATGRALASILWCVEAWQVRVPVAWTAAALGQLEMHAAGGTLEPAALGTALQAMARMGLKPDAVIAGWTARVVESVVMRAAANVNASAGDRKIADPVAAEEVTLWPHPVGGDRVTREVGDLDGRCARIILWSLARLRCQVSDQVAGWLALKASECETMVPDAAAEAGTVLFPEALKEQAKAGPGAGSHHRLSGRAGAELETGGTDEARCLLARERTGARNVCVALWALASTSSRPNPDVMRQLTRRATMDMQSASDSELLTIVRSFAAMGFRPGARFRRAAEDRIVRLAPRLTQDQMAAVLTWCARLQWQLSADVCELLRDVAL